MKLHSIGRLSRYTALATAAFLLFAAAPVKAIVINPLTDSFTSVFFEPDFHGSGIDALENTLNGSTHMMYDDEPNLSLISPGTYHGEAAALFGTLGALVTIGGPGVIAGRTSTSYTDFKTITDPNIPNGTVGSTQFGFNVNVSSLVTPAPGLMDASGDFSSFALTVVAGDTFDVVLSHVEKFSAGDAINLNAGGPGGLLSDPVSFVYGQPFFFKVGFSVSAFTDSQFVKQHSNPFFLEYALGTVESVTTQGLNTAELSTIIVNGVNSPDTIVTGQSGSDYSQFVLGNSGGAGPPPIPEPSTILLSLLALGVGMSRPLLNLVG